MDKVEYGKSATDVIVEQNYRIIELLEMLVYQNNNNDFNIKTQKEAAKIVGCCVENLRKAIKNGTLKKDIDYRYNDTRYLFSTSSLKKHKGTL